MACIVESASIGAACGTNAKHSRRRFGHVRSAPESGSKIRGDDACRHGSLRANPAFQTPAKKEGPVSGRHRAQVKGGNAQGGRQSRGSVTTDFSTPGARRKFRRPAFTVINCREPRSANEFQLLKMWRRLQNRWPTRHEFPRRMLFAERRLSIPGQPATSLAAINRHLDRFICSLAPSDIQVRGRAFRPKGAFNEETEL